MSNQQFCLRWHSYQPHFVSMLASLLDNCASVDVTLVAEGKTLRAHKMILSSCSAYLQKLLTDNPTQHPIVIFDNVKHSDLEILVKFMYCGQVNVSQDQLPQIFETAKMLKIKGLTEINDQTFDKSSDLSGELSQHSDVECHSGSPQSQPTAKKRPKKILGHPSGVQPPPSSEQPKRITEAGTLDFSRNEMSSYSSLDVDRLHGEQRIPEHNTSAEYGCFADKNISSLPNCSMVGDEPPERDIDGCIPPRISDQIPQSAPGSNNSMQNEEFFMSQSPMMCHGYPRTMTSHNMASPCDSAGSTPFGAILHGYGAQPMASSSSGCQIQTQDPYEMDDESPGPSGENKHSINQPLNAPIKRPRKKNPQAEENFQKALEAVRFGGVGFCKAAKMFGVNNRTLWLEFKKLGYVTNRPSIKRRIKKEPSPNPDVKQEHAAAQHAEAANVSETETSQMDNAGLMAYMEPYVPTAAMQTVTQSMAQSPYLQHTAEAAHNLPLNFQCYNYNAIQYKLD